MTDWRTLSPLQIAEWVRVNIPVLGVERAASEVEKLSDKFNEIGFPNPTTSILVTTEMTKHLKPPPGWDAAHVQMWRQLPYRLARYVSEKREQDHKALRKCQNIEAEMRRQKERKNAPVKTATG